jgi:hypothetical protein
MRLVTAALLIAFMVVPAYAGDEPSVKEGIDEVGRAVRDDVKEGYDKTKDATVHGYEKAKDATEKGVGTALDKTGEGVGKAGASMEGAGEKVKGKAEGE